MGSTMHFHTYFALLTLLPPSPPHTVWVARFLPPLASLMLSCYMGSISLLSHPSLKTHPSPCMVPFLFSQLTLPPAIHTSIKIKV